jgi:hypothetical protein
MATFVESSDHEPTFLLPAPRVGCLLPSVSRGGSSGDHDGPIPRFGSRYFVLRCEAAKPRSFTFAGSDEPQAAERSARARISTT